MWKREGMNTTDLAKKAAQEVYIKDKLDRKQPSCTKEILICRHQFRRLVTIILKFFLAHLFLRPGWFLHENVTNYPQDYLAENLGRYFEVESTTITPQRFGKPMNRHIVESHVPA